MHWPAIYCSALLVLLVTCFRFGPGRLQVIIGLHNLEQVLQNSLAGGLNWGVGEERLLALSSY